MVPRGRCMRNARIFMALLLHLINLFLLCKTYYTEKSAPRKKEAS
jgi:hypothetical protein